MEIQPSTITNKINPVLMALINVLLIGLPYLILRKYGRFFILYFLLFITLFVYINATLFLAIIAIIDTYFQTVNWNTNTTTRRNKNKGLNILAVITIIITVVLLVVVTTFPGKLAWSKDACGTLYMFNSQAKILCLQQFQQSVEITDLIEEKAVNNNEILVLTKPDTADKTWPPFISEKHGFQINFDKKYQPKEVVDGLDTIEMVGKTPATVQSGISIRIVVDPVTKVVTDLKSEYSELEEERDIVLNSLSGVKLLFHLKEYPFGAYYYIVTANEKTYILKGGHSYDEVFISTFQIIQDISKVERISD